MAVKARAKRVPVCPKAILKECPRIRAVAIRHLRPFRVDPGKNILLANIHARLHEALCKAHRLAKKRKVGSYLVRFVAALTEVAAPLADTVERVLRMIIIDLSLLKAGTG